MDFIFMLTRGDKTITDCLELFEQIAPLGIKHVGFKDIGVPAQTLKTLAKTIRRSGATCYLEMVSDTPEACLRSAQMARDLGIDRLLGGTQIDEIAGIIRGTGIDHYPFPGQPSGHPTSLGGSPGEIEEHCRAFMAAGCAGADLLAYRALEADPIELVNAARRGLGSGYLIVAGSVTSPQQIRALSAAGADAFTVGTAMFEGSYSPRLGSILSQLGEVMRDCRAGPSLQRRGTG